MKYFAVLVVGFVCIAALEAVPIKTKRSILTCGSLQCPADTFACIRKSNNDEDPLVLKTTFQCVDKKYNVVDSEIKSVANPFGGGIEISTFLIQVQLQDEDGIGESENEDVHQKPVKKEDKFRDVETFQ